jgi:hypothetical protein
MQMDERIKYLQFEILKTTEPGTGGTIYHATFDGMPFMSSLNLTRLKKDLKVYKEEK